MSKKEIVLIAVFGVVLSVAFVVWFSAYKSLIATQEAKETAVHSAYGIVCNRLAWQEVGSRHTAGEFITSPRSLIDTEVNEEYSKALKELRQRIWINCPHNKRNWNAIRSEFDRILGAKAKFVSEREYRRMMYKYYLPLGTFKLGADLPKEIKVNYIAANYLGD